MAQDHFEQHAFAAAESADSVHLSSYNRGNKQFQISSALLFNFWSAAANACLGNDSKFDSAVCTMEDPKFGKVVVIMSAKDTNSEVLDKLLSVPKAGLE
jgi:nitrate reductase NapAB chaperone NapD